MKKIFFFFACSFLFVFVNTVHAATVWKPITPTGYTPISWVKARGVASFMKAPTGNGYTDFLTIVYLPFNQIRFIASTTPKSWGPAKPPFDVFVPAVPTTTPISTSTVNAEADVADPFTTPPTPSSVVPAAGPIQNWAVPKLVAEGGKGINKNVQFVWNAPFFNINGDTTDLSLSLKASFGTSTYITSGSRPANDMAQSRRMLTINNIKGVGAIADFDEAVFVNTSTSDQAVEGFAPGTQKNDGPGVATGRLFLGMKPNGKELVIYCSRGASVSEASDALTAAGVPVDSQLQADGGASAACGYNLPGQYFVEPGRMLPYLMGALPVVYRGTITTKATKVRRGAGSKFAVVRTLAKGTPVAVLQEKNGFVRIGDGDEWVLASYIKKQ